MNEFLLIASLTILPMDDPMVKLEVPAHSPEHCKTLADEIVWKVHSHLTLGEGVDIVWRCEKIGQHL